MFYQTISIDEEGIWLVGDQLDKYAGSLIRNSPLGVVATEEQLDPKVPVMVTRFHLVVDEDFGDYDIKTEKQADKLIEAMRKAADEVRKANDWNYVVVRPPKKAFR